MQILIFVFFFGILGLFLFSIGYGIYHLFTFSEEKIESSLQKFVSRVQENIDPIPDTYYDKPYAGFEEKILQKKYLNYANQFHVARNTNNFLEEAILQMPDFYIKKRNLDTITHYFNSEIL